LVKGKGERGKKKRKGGKDGREKKRWEARRTSLASIGGGV